MVLGHESIGRVIRVGSGVRNFKPGDLVTRVGTTAFPEIGLHVSWGGFTEFGVAKDHIAMRKDGLPKETWNSSRINQRIPASYDPAECTMIITWRETLSYLRRAGVWPGSNVLILGSGGNAMAFTVHARNLGANLIVCSGGISRADALRQLGATSVFDYRESNLEASVRELKIEFDFIVDAVGKANQVNRVLPLLKHGGTVCIYGLDDYNALSIDPARANGSFLVYGGGYDEEETHEEVIARIGDGTLTAKPWFEGSDPFDLNHINSAFDAVRARKCVKALVRLAAE